MAELEYRVPHPELREFFSLYYLLKSEDALIRDHERASMAQVRFALRGDGVVEFQRGKRIHCEGTFIIGPTSGAMKFELAGPIRMFGMGFLPAGWGALTHADASDYVDTAFPAVQLFRNIDRHIEILKACDNIDEMAEAADEVLRSTIREADPAILEFTRMVGGWLASSVSPDLADLHDMTALSDRQLTRKVKQYYGLPPKYLARKYRALRAGRALFEADADEADFLRDAFYDQSHMIRELKLFTGTTPAKLRKQEGEIARLIDQRIEYAGQISPLSSQT